MRLLREYSWTNRATIFRQTKKTVHDLRVANSPEFAFGVTMESGK